MTQGRSSQEKTWIFKQSEDEGNEDNEMKVNFSSTVD